MCLLFMQLHLCASGQRFLKAFKVEVTLVHKQQIIGRNAINLCLNYPLQMRYRAISGLSLLYIKIKVAPSLILEHLTLTTFSFLKRWLRNFAKNKRYHSAIVRNIRFQ